MERKKRTSRNTNITRKFDYSIFITIVIILAIGIIMVWSASMYNAKLTSDNEFEYVLPQLLYGLVGLGLMVFISLIDYRFVKKFYWVPMVFALLSLVLVFVPGIGVESNGAMRWVKLGPIRYQPSEVAKFASIIFLAAYFEKHKEDIPSFTKGFLPTMGFLILLCLLVVLEKSLSVALTLAILILGVYFLAGANLKHIALIMGTVAAGGTVFVIKEFWRMERIKAYLDPFAYYNDEGWQVCQSLMALGSGGLFGQGVGNGRAKLLFMPEPQNDFIFANIGEELGFVGAILVIGLYLFLMYKMLLISMDAPDMFSALYVGGIIIFFGVQVFVNIGVVTNLLPVTGMQLPLISYGGTSLLMTLVSLGVVLNISRHKKSARREAR